MAGHHSNAHRKNRTALEPHRASLLRNCALVHDGCPNQDETRTVDQTSRLMWRSLPLAIEGKSIQAGTGARDSFSVVRQAKPVKTSHKCKSLPEREYRPRSGPSQNIEPAREERAGGKFRRINDLPR